jgi:hypothetical protein
MQYDLFQLQTQLVDAKVDIAVGKAIDRVIDRIDALKTEVHELKHDMNEKFYDLRQDMNTRFGAVEGRLAVVESKLNTKEETQRTESRLAVVESKLSIKEETQRKIQDRLIEYIFKTGWLILAVIVSAVFLYFHIP